jgi:hypothetical protein
MGSVPIFEAAMKDKAKIYIGIVIFLGLVSFPLWHRSAGSPEIMVKTRNAPGKDRCVMPVEYMRAFHMNLLKDWRETVVRTGDRNYSSPDGRTFRRSLTNTCLDCHSNKSTFCDSCHHYMAVNPNCWDCHVAPPEETR